MMKILPSPVIQFSVCEPSQTIVVSDFSTPQTVFTEMYGDYFYASDTSFSSEEVIINNQKVNCQYKGLYGIIGSSDSAPTSKIYIFDRFGKFLKQFNPLLFGRDGSYINDPLSSSDCQFLMKYAMNHTQKKLRVTLP